ncbi:hypothetical protein JH06_2391 [Blastocystis sp. subtype 4]|uniref:hypothetical protein n=1 Tax=Blastocystis sp. subtype 4 TaxID=944170 RepID=UPI00071186EF|nr:hypothetical protein JH06_2391 [Blastocystis sp. subtype 4]KNB43661.1 hypothetical protein JH06_2391 [Blastocystis sp. subtype 4]|eukprot:XP_014527104.1 hypothetical protein JH06_2391 [Blastocystis sp. subtype 4]
MSRGNYNNARLLLQRALRINHSSKLLWKEYFRFELLYINVVEERRRILGLPSLKDRLLGESKDATLKELVEEADVKPGEEKQLNETNIPEEVTDLELLDQEGSSKPMELSDSEGDQDEAKKNAEVDQMIHGNSDAMQAEFLRGAIPKVIYKHAIEACDDPVLAVDLLRISYELNNVFVEQFIIQSILDESPRDLNVWSDLISYPVTRINDELSVSEPDEILEKRRNRDIEESCQMTKQLSIQMVESLKDQVQLSSIFATIIKALTISSKALSVTGNTDPLNQTVETFYAKAQEMEAVNAQVIAEMLKFYASQGRMEDCMKCLKSHQELLLSEIESFLSTIAMIISVASRADYLIQDVFNVKDIPQFIISLFTAGIHRFRETAKKEELLQIYIRYLKYLISIQYDKTKVEKVFMDTFMVIPELNSPVFILYLSYSYDHGMDSLRSAVDFGLSHEVLIPLDSDVLEECLDYEKRWLASLSDEQEKEKKNTVSRIEKLYDTYCTRYNQNPEVWLGYMEFERLHDGYKNIRVIYNRAQHMIKDMNAFEEKFNLFQVQGHL